MPDDTATQAPCRRCAAPKRERCCDLMIRKAWPIHPERRVALDWTESVMALRDINLPTYLFSPGIAITASGESHDAITGPRHKIGRPSIAVVGRVWCRCAGAGDDPIASSVTTTTWYGAGSALRETSETRQVPKTPQQPPSTPCAQTSIDRSRCCTASIESGCDGAAPRCRLYQRSSHGPSKAPSADAMAMPSVYQTATKLIDNSSHDSA